MMLRDTRSQWRTSILKTSQDVLGLKTKQNEDWFDENDEEIEHLISKKWQTHCAWQRDITSQAKREAHSRAKALVRWIRELKNKWWTQKASESQQLADAGNTQRN